MPSKKVGPYSWVPPRLALLYRDDITAIKVNLRAHDLVEFMVKKELQVMLWPTVKMAKFNALMSGDCCVKDRLSIAFSSTKKELYETNWPEEPQTIRIYWHGAFLLPSEDEVLVFAGTNKPSRQTEYRYENLISEATRAFKKYQEIIREYDKETKIQKEKKEIWHAEHPELKQFDYGFDEIKRRNERPILTADSLTGLFPKAVYFLLGRKTSYTRITCEAEKNASKSGWSSPRDNMYEGFITYDIDHKKTCVISWLPHDGLPAFPEVRWAVKRQLPRAFRNPRLTELSRSIPTNSEHKIRIMDWDDHTDWEIGFVDAQLDDTDYQSRISSTQEALQQDGFEAIAWYQPFHSWTEKSWGIYFDAEKLDDFALTIFDTSRKQRAHCQFDLCCQLSFGLIYSHEIFHARVEAVLSWLELNDSRSRYNTYFDNVYKHLSGTDELLEESLANWSSWQWFQSFLERLDESRLQDIKALEEAIETILDLSPAGYNRWRDGHHKNIWRHLATQIVKGKADIIEKRLLPLDGLLSVPPPFDFLHSDIPLHFIGEGQIVDRLTSLPAVINIPARKEITRALRYFKYVLKTGGGKGSHEKWVGPDNRAFMLPKRDPLSRGVFKTFLEHFDIDKMTYAREIRPNL